MVREVPDILNMGDWERASFIKQSCPCCYLNPNMKQLKLWCDVKELAPYGTGYVSYFILLKLAAFLCFLMALVNIWKIKENINAGRCVSSSDVEVSDACKRDWITRHSIVNYGEHKFDVTDRVIMLIFLAVYLLLVSLHSIYVQHIENKLQEQTADQSEWSIVVSKIVTSFMVFHLK